LQATGDPSLVRNLLQNLVGNAWKFTRDRGDARIEVGRDGEGMFFVRDNGAGFAPEYAGKLFRPFQRLHSQEQFAGDGIGLASVKRIVERHGGTIHAEGGLGAGATFRFTLPEPDRE
jgi:signal transduction histidine kinase